MALPQKLIDLGYEEAPIDPAARDQARRAKSVNGHHVYLLPHEEQSRDEEEAAWAAEAPSRAWAALRSERDSKLAATDWRASSDLTLSADWAAYRQALRDLPASYDDTTVQGEITWPSEPS